MAVADGAGLPLALYTTSASPHEVKLVSQTIEPRLITEKPAKLIGDKAYDSAPLDSELIELGIEMIAPHKRNRKKARTVSISLNRNQCWVDRNWWNAASAAERQALTTHEQGHMDIIPIQFEFDVSM